MFLGAPDFARSEKKHSHRFSIFCVFTQPRSKADVTLLNFDVRIPPKADIRPRDQDVRYVPKADKCTAAYLLAYW